MNLFTALQGGWPVTRQDAAILSERGTWTWDDLDRATAMVANLLGSLHLQGRNGHPPIVAAHLDKSVEALVLYLATLRCGAVFLPLNPAYRAAELGYFLEDARPAVLVCRPDDQEWVIPLAAHGQVGHLFTLGTQGNGSLLTHACLHSDQHETEPRHEGELAAILYTSGTTGRSKGAMLTHGNLLSNARTLLRHWDWRHDDCLVHALPIFHIHGLFVACHCALLSGTPMRWLDAFQPTAVLHHIADRSAPQATLFMGVPTMYGRLLAQPELQRDLVQGMRLFISGSAPLSPTAFEAFQARTGHTILERYGMSETGMLCSNPCRSREGARVAGSVGKPLPGVQLRIVDDEGAPLAADQTGHVEVRGPNVFVGYLGMPEKTAAAFTPDGWFRTGDVGRIDHDGRLHLVGRAKDLVITGGLNVYPAEVESLLDRLPGVTESAVIGVPHPDFGEGVVAVLTTQAGHVLDEAEVIRAMREQLSAFKCPKRVFVADELPRNAMGKVQKNLLRQRYADAFAQEARTQLAQARTGS
jgi:malonyl-CoA/methylmalonyl-CoA synthetase